jgi:hypothetical protein
VSYSSEVPPRGLAYSFELGPCFGCYTVREAGGAVCRARMVPAPMCRRVLVRVRAAAAPRFGWGAVVPWAGGEGTERAHSGDYSWRLRVFFVGHGSAALQPA